MSNKPIKMNRLRQIIRLYCQGTGIKTIHGMVGISRNTIKKYVRVWHTLGITHEEFSAKSDSELAILFTTTVAKTAGSPRMQVLESMLPKISKRLKKKGVTREMLHAEYIAKHPDGYGRSRFNNAVHTYLQLSKPVMHVDHKAGDKMYIDFTGSKLQLTTSQDDTAHDVEVFVAILGVKAMQKTGKPVILVLNEGRPRLVYDLVTDAKSVIDIMLPGNYGGDALANLLSGDANFSGKLPFTYPLQPNALTNYDYKVSDQNVSLTGTFDYSYKGHASYQWQFGTGLSYTTFQYSNLKANKTVFNSDDELEFSIDVKNTGDKVGKESVLLYSSQLYASLMPDNKRLRAFDKIELKPGETQNVKFKLKASDLAFVGADAKWVLEEGDFTVTVGSERLKISCNQPHKWDKPNIED